MCCKLNHTLSDLSITRCGSRGRDERSMKVWFNLQNTALETKNQLIVYNLVFLNGHSKMELTDVVFSFSKVSLVV